MHAERRKTNDLSEIPALCEELLGAQLRVAWPRAVEVIYNSGQVHFGLESTRGVVRSGNTRCRVVANDCASVTLQLVTPAMWATNEQRF